jgi:hypothetical protein
MIRVSIASFNPILKLVTENGKNYLYSLSKVGKMWVQVVQSGLKYDAGDAGISP